MSKRIAFKSVIAIVMVGFILSVSSCQKEEKKIIGVWKLENNEVTDFACSDPIATMILRPIIQQFMGGGSSDVEYEFTKNGKVNVHTGGMIETLTYKVNDSKLLLTTNGMTQSYDLSFPEKKTMQWNLNMDKSTLALYSKMIAMALKYEGIDVGDLEITKFSMRTMLKKQ